MSDLVRYDSEDRALARVMKQAELFAGIPGLKKEIAGNPKAVAGIILSLQGEGLPITLRNINDRFHWIEGRATDTAQSVMALAFRAGYRLEPVIRTADLAVVAIYGPEGNRTESQYTLADARRAGRFDEWVEVWRRDGDRNRKVTFTVRVDGIDITDPPWPDWVQAEVTAGRVKRYDAWFNYRTDMLYKSAAVRAVRIACPQVLLGDDSGGGAITPPTPGMGSSGAAERDIIDADVVDEPVPDHVRDDQPEAYGSEPGNERYDPADPKRPFK